MLSLHPVQFAINPAALPTHHPSAARCAPQVRKGAHSAALELLRAHAHHSSGPGGASGLLGVSAVKAGSKSPFGQLCSQYVAATLDATKAADPAAALHLLPFVRDALALLPPACAAAIAASVAQLPRLGHAHLTASALHTLAAAAATPDLALPSATLCAVLEALRALPPAEVLRDDGGGSALGASGYCRLAASCVRRLRAQGSDEAFRAAAPWAANTLVRICEEGASLSGDGVGGGGLAASRAACDALGVLVTCFDAPLIEEALAASAGTPASMVSTTFGEVAAPPAGCPPPRVRPLAPPCSLLAVT